MNGSVNLPVWLVALSTIAIVVLVVIVWSIKRRGRVRLTNGRWAEGSPVDTVSGLLQSTVVEGNAIELVQDGAFFDALFADIGRATATVNLESFLAREGEVTRRLTDLLLRKRAEGVEVRILLDASGGRKFGDRDVERLREAGCVVRKFHPFVLRNLGRINQRTHRKMAIIDGRVGYVGGHCLVDTWLGEAQDLEHFRDVTARVEGPVVNQLQSAFSENWIEESGEVLAGDRFFPAPEPAGSSKAHVVFASPSGAPSLLKLLHYIAIDGAQKSITIQNPYFLPDPDARRALLEAVRRGVEVRVMLPSADATDAKLVSHASHHRYGMLLEGGVRIFEYEKTLLHQKVFTIDGSWSSVGSTNFDDRSFEINEEVSLVVWDARIAQQLEEIFKEDLLHSRERHAEEWAKRSLAHKLRDGLSFLVNEQL